jgi:hypothetical protein
MLSTGGDAGQLSRVHICAFRPLFAHRPQAFGNGWIGRPTDVRKYFSIGFIAPDFLTIFQIGDRRVLIANPQR